MTWQIQQRINFYLEEFRPPVLPQPIRRLLWQLLLSVLLMLCVGLMVLAYRQWLWNTEQQAEQLTQRLTLQLEHEMARRPPLVVDSGLQQQVEAARRQLSNSQKILLYLSREHLQQSQSLTPLIAQLGEQPVTGIWLQGFSLRDAGQHVRLLGFVDDPARLSGYVSALLQRSAYSGKSFRQIDVQRTGERWLSFVLDTEAVAADASALTGPDSELNPARSGGRL
ncbi:MAG: hypothetical protein LRY66_04310 [Saccharospirillaceae bacterium]|nr:hypothetical protein [Saccharospirillaceae bacterium]MCD8530582.1 hypothetical protein [Saccharospirillaceae bacterium]